MSKIRIKVPKVQKTKSEQTVMAQRMPSRTYKDKKKNNAKYCCRNKRPEDSGRYFLCTDAIFKKSQIVI